MRRGRSSAGESVKESVCVKSAKFTIQHLLVAVVKSQGILFLYCHKVCEKSFLVGKSHVVSRKYLRRNRFLQLYRRLCCQRICLG